MSCPICGGHVRICGFRALNVYYRCQSCSITFLEQLPTLEDDLLQAADNAQVRA